MRADGVEVTQNDHRHRVVGRVHVLHNLLDHQLRLSVGRRRRRNGEVLADRHRLRLAVDRGGGRENEAFAAVFPHRLHRDDGAVQIDAIVFQRLLHRLADRLQTREMDHRFNAVLSEDFIHRGAVGRVLVVEFRPDAGNRFDFIQHRQLGIVKVVNDDNVLAAVEQLDDGVRADVARTARDQNGHKRSLLLIHRILYTQKYRFSIGILKLFLRRPPHIIVQKRKRAVSGGA